MEGLFSHASAFNQPIGRWNVSSVVHMKGIFEGAAALRQPLYGTFNGRRTDWNLDGVVTDGPRGLQPFVFARPGFPPAVAPPPDATCRICLADHEDPDEADEAGGLAELRAPCGCAGTMAWVHRGCLERETARARTTESRILCMACRQPYRDESAPDEARGVSKRQRRHARGGSGDGCAACGAAPRACGRLESVH